MRRILFIVSPDRPDIYDGLRKTMDREPHVEVMYERRQAPPRKRPGPVPGPARRRSPDRRDTERARITADVRVFGWAVVRVEI